jgi:hypothetical protein
LKCNLHRYAKAGLINFAEPCIPECHGGKEACDACKRDVGFTEVGLYTLNAADP